MGCRRSRFSGPFGFCRRLAFTQSGIPASLLRPTRADTPSLATHPATPAGFWPGKARRERTRAGLGIPAKRRGARACSSGALCTVDIALSHLLESQNMKPDPVKLQELLDESVRLHGHLCPGQVLGVRMAMLGLKEIGIADPKGTDRKNLIVFVEMDRCATDAIQSVTGCSLGHRTMKFLDYGKMAATFLNLKTQKAARIVAREESREKAAALFPRAQDKYRAQIEAYRIMEDPELFEVMEVTVKIPPQDMPGRPLRRVPCSSCGEFVQDMREVRQGGQVLCIPCARGGYYDRVPIRRAATPGDPSVRSGTTGAQK